MSSKRQIDPQKLAFALKKMTESPVKFRPIVMKATGGVRVYNKLFSKASGRKSVVIDEDFEAVFAASPEFEKLIFGEMPETSTAGADGDKYEKVLQTLARFERLIESQKDAEYYRRKNEELTEQLLKHLLPPK